MSAADSAKPREGSGNSEEVKRNLPGWTLPRDTPRQKEKYGADCPTPTIQDWEDYKKWKAGQQRKDELPAATQVFLADSSILFYKDPDVQLPWVHRLKCELPRRVGRLSGDLPVKASYIGFGTNDDPTLYDLFKEAMAKIGVVLCRQIHHPPNRFELAHLEQSDLIYVGGGDRKRLWETLGTDIGSSETAEHVKWRYLCGAVVIAVGEAMSLLGTKSWYSLGEGKVVPFKGWKIFPHIVASEAENVDLEDMVEQLGGPGVVILGVSPGGALIFNTDGLVEPVRHMVQEYRWDYNDQSVKRALLIGPPRGTGLVCPLYAAMKEREADDPEGEADVWAYALTQEEERDEEHLIEQFDIHNAWLSVECRNEVEQLKQQGNEAFKAGKADLAGLSYEQARVLIRNGACSWSKLDEDTLGKFGRVPSEAQKETPKLPSERRAAATAAATEEVVKKEDHRATPLLTSLLLNLCACYLLAYEQDVERERQREKASLGDTKGRVDSEQAADADQSTTTLVEVRDNLAAAFRAANEALELSSGGSAKAWYRRGCVFEKMRDPRNAVRDFEAALLRAPGDKAIARRRDAASEEAGKVAENMYYARHKELDKQVERLKLETRRAMLLRGSYSDAYVDKDKQFSIAQPLARVVEGRLEEVDGRPQLVLEGDAAGGSREDAAHLHPHALWTWEFLVQKAPGLRLLEIENVDLGSGPLEWLCKGLRTHTEIRSLRFTGVHLGAAGAKMLRNVIAQTKSIFQISLNDCALHDAGLDAIAEGLREHRGPLEALSLRRNHLTSKRLSTLVKAFAAPDAEAEPGEPSASGLAELDLSENLLGSAGAKEVSKIIGSDASTLRIIRLQNAMIELAGFWRLVNNLSDTRPLTQLDLRCNPIGRGTRRIWRGTMGPNIRCDVLFSDQPVKARKQAQTLSKDLKDDETGAYPLPRRWA